MSDPYLDLLGHVIGLSSLDLESGRPDVWVCSCGVRGDVAGMVKHIQKDIGAQVQARLHDASVAGALKLPG